jgi:NAD dependent epimerase/dehydratase family enzyme
MRTLRRVMGMPIGLPATEWMVRFAVHWILRTDPDLVLCGRYVVSTRLREEGFEFRYPALEEALRDLLS